MKRIMTTELADHVGERVKVAGWIHHQRHLANRSFLLLRDAGGVGQIVIEDESVRGIATRAASRDGRRDRRLRRRVGSRLREESSSTRPRSPCSANRRRRHRSRCVGPS